MLLLRKGHILLIGGGAAVIIGLAMLGYYAVRLVEALEDEKYTIEPSSSAEITQNITAAGGQAAYLVTFTELGGIRPTITVHDPAGLVMLQRTVDQPVVVETFAVIEDGVYTLALSNPSPESALEAGIILDSYDAILGRGALSPATTVVFWLLLVAGAGAAVAGAVMLVMDRRRMGKMKQFGDMSDLV